MKWKITYHTKDKDWYYYVSTWKERESRILFIDEKTGLAKNLPYHMCSVEEVR